VSIFVGIFIAYILHPLYNLIARRIPNKSVATTIFMIILILLVAIPLWFILPIVVREVFNMYLSIQKLDLTTVVYQVLNHFVSQDLSRVIAVQANVILTNFFNFSLQAVSNTFSNLPNMMFQTAVVLFTLFFVTRDSDKIRTYLTELSPLSESTERKFSEELRNITNSVLLGQFVVGVIQGLVLGLGMWILGVQNALFLTFLAVVCCIIPVIGSWVIWVPVTIFMFISGNVLGGAIFFFYSLLFVATVDNFLRAYWISKTSKLHMFTTIIGTIGGLYTFGLPGLILGPLILSYVLIILEFYKQGKLNELFKE